MIKNKILKESIDKLSNEILNSEIFFHVKDEYKKLDKKLDSEYKKVFTCGAIYGFIVSAIIVVIINYFSNR